MSLHLLSASISLNIAISVMMDYIMLLLKKKAHKPTNLWLKTTKVYFSPTYALWVTSWLCPMFPNQDPRNQVREREHDWWDCREKIDHGNSHTGSSYSLETTHNARISLGKASHMAKPAITAVGKYNFSQGEAVIIFER